MFHKLPSVFITCIQKCYSIARQVIHLFSTWFVIESHDSCWTANDRAWEVDGRVQALVVGLGLASDTCYHINYFAVCTWRLINIWGKPKRAPCTIWGQQWNLSSCLLDTRDEAIMLVKLSVILFSNSIILPIMLTDFTYYSQNYCWFNAHGVTDS